MKEKGPPNIVAILGLALALGALMTRWIPTNIVVCLVAVVLSGIGLVHSRVLARGRWVALSGVILGIVGLVIYVNFTISLMSTPGQVNQNFWRSSSIAIRSFETDEKMRELKLVLSNNMPKVIRITAVTIIDPQGRSHILAQNMDHAIMSPSSDEPLLFSKVSFKPAAYKLKISYIDFNTGDKFTFDGGANTFQAKPR